MTRIKFVNGSLLTVLLSVIYFSTAAAADNVVAIVAKGSPVTNGGLDGDGYAYSASLLGTSLSWAGSTFTLGTPGTFNAARRTTITLPARNASTVNLLATAANGNQAKQTFVVTYTDGTTQSFTQSLSDWMTPQEFGGESKVSEMAYRATPSGATQNGPFYVYGYSFAINSAKTVQSITLPDNPNVVVLAAAVAASGTVATPPTAPPPGSTSQVDNVVGIVAEGSPVTNGGLDREGYAYAANLLGASLNWAGSTFKFGAPGTFDAASGKTIALSASNASTVNLLATAVNGNQPNQTFVVTYTDGSTKSYTQSLSDWGRPQQYGGESKVSEMAYRIRPSGATENVAFYLYGYSFATNSAKTVKSITLPNNRNVVVLAVNASATGTTPTPPTPPTQPAPTSIKSPVYLDGKFYWGGDWNAVPFNYAQAGAGVDGPGPVIGEPGGVKWLYWLPYPPHNPAGPASNGVNFDLSGFTYFTIAIKPSQAGALAQMQFFRADGGTNDIPYGTMLIFSQGKYGPATMVAGQWNVYKIPLADFGVSGWIYKFIVQQQGVTPQSWEIDQVGFE